MNIETSKKHPSLWLPIWLETLLLRVSPQKGVQKAVMWLALPISLLFLNMGVSLLRATLVTPYIPFLAMLAASACFRFRMAGLVGSFLLLATFALLFLPHIEARERMWHVGIFFSLSITLFILVLIVEYCQDSLLQLQLEKERYQDRSEVLSQELQRAVRTWEEKEKDFVEEIQRLKEEAAQRKIERVAELKNIELIMGEIQLLNGQKDSFIEEAREARQCALDDALRLKQLEQEHTLTLSSFKQQEQQLQQFVEKNDLLSAQLQEEQQKLDTMQEDFTSTTRVLKQQITLLQQQITREKAEWQHTELLHKEQIAMIQETILKLQAEKALLVKKVDPLTMQEITQLQASLTAAEQRYEEFRKQFTEKTKILVQTRKALFALEGVYLGTLKEHAFVLEAEAEISYEENNRLAYLLRQQCAFIEQLEQEISSLEGLISHILFP